MEHMPCHMRHHPPYEGSDCIYGYCMRCRNEHCAFDSCVLGARVIRVLPIATIELPGIPGLEMN